MYLYVYLQVLGHEVKELGTHILVCEVTYTTATGEKLNFRKFFKFQVCGMNNKEAVQMATILYEQVMKPLDVKTKFYNAESDEVFLEAQVQNITATTITIDKVTAVTMMTTIMMITMIMTRWPWSPPPPSRCPA